MTEELTRSIRIVNSEGKETSGSLRLRVYGPRERMKRAMKALGICWGLAVVTVFIPIAHFVLVPGFFIAGPVTAFLRYRVTETMDSVTGHCPTCGEEVTIPLEASDQLPKWTYCPVNNDPVQLLEA